MSFREVPIQDEVMESLCFASSETEEIWIAEKYRTLHNLRTRYQMLHNFDKKAEEDMDFIMIEKQMDALIATEQIQNMLRRKRKVEYGAITKAFGVFGKDWI